MIVTRRYCETCRVEINVVEEAFDRVLGLDCADQEHIDNDHDLSEAL